jgi:hypothetical protein
MKNKASLIRYTNLPEMLINVKNRFYYKDAIRWIQKSNNTIQTISFNELKDSDCKAIFVDNLNTLKKINSIANEGLKVKMIVIFYPKNQSIKIYFLFRTFKNLIMSFRYLIN